MDQILEVLVQPQTILAILVSIAVFATILTVAAPILVRDNFSKRMKTVAVEREKIRARERARIANQQKAGSLKQNQENYWSSLVDRFNLKKAFVDEATTSNLEVAGYRQTNHLTIFIALKILAPIVFCVGATIYLFVVSPAERTTFMNFAVILFAGAAGFYMPTILLKNQMTKRQQSLKRAWPDALDLMLICVESGMSLEATMKKVSFEVGEQSPELAEELTLTTAELSYLQERRQAHENLARRTGLEAVKSVTMAFIQAERYGTPLSNALRSLAQESRDMRMAEAEKKAASLPPKLTVPMIVFFLPVLFAVILGPAIIQIMEQQ